MPVFIVYKMASSNVLLVRTSRRGERPSCSFVPIWYQQKLSRRATSLAGPFYKIGSTGLTGTLYPAGILPCAVCEMIVPDRLLYPS